MTDTITIRPAAADEILRNAALLTAHWDEVALNKDLMVLAPDVGVYLALESVGKLLILGAYAGDEMIGYAASILNTHPHYADLVVANNDVLFVRKDHRNGRTGLRLIKEMERVAEHAGAKMVLWHAKSGTRLEQLLPRLGYGVQDVVFSKGVRDGV